MPYIKGDYYLICDRTGFKIRRSEAVRDGYGYIVKQGHEDPKHPQETIRSPRPERQPSLIRPEAQDYFLTHNEVQSDLSRVPEVGFPIGLLLVLTARLN